MLLSPEGTGSGPARVPKTLLEGKEARSAWRAQESGCTLDSLRMAPPPTPAHLCSSDNRNPQTTKEVNGVETKRN